MYGENSEHHSAPVTDVSGPVADTSSPNLSAGNRGPSAPHAPHTESDNTLSGGQYGITDSDAPQGAPSRESTGADKSAKNKKKKKSNKKEQAKLHGISDDNALEKVQEAPKVSQPDARNTLAAQYGIPQAANEVDKFAADQNVNDEFAGPEGDNDVLPQVGGDDNTFGQFASQTPAPDDDLNSAIDTEFLTSSDDRPKYILDLRS